MNSFALIAGTRLPPCPLHAAWLGASHTPAACRAACSVAAAEKLRGHLRDGSSLRSLSWGRGAGRAYLSTPREESSRKDPLAAELGASAREDR